MFKNFRFYIIIVLFIFLIYWRLRFIEPRYITIDHIDKKILLYFWLSFLTAFRIYLRIRQIYPRKKEGTIIPFFLLGYIIQLNYSSIYIAIGYGVFW